MWWDIRWLDGVNSFRSRLRRRSQNVADEEDAEESKDIEEVIIGKDSEDDFKFGEVVGE